MTDDWNAYRYKCVRCGERYHASEGGCSTCEKCERCGEWFAPGGIEDGLCETCFDIVTDEIIEAAQNGGGAHR